jgi:hypothetical protein
MWVKSRKVGSGKRQQRWDDDPPTMGEREMQRCERVRRLLQEQAAKYRAVINSMVGKAEGRGGASSAPFRPIR